MFLSSGVCNLDLCFSSSSAYVLCKSLKKITRIVAAGDCHSHLQGFRDMLKKLYLVCGKIADRASRGGVSLSAPTVMFGSGLQAYKMNVVVLIEHAASIFSLS